MTVFSQNFFYIFVLIVIINIIALTYLYRKCTNIEHMTETAGGSISSENLLAIKNLGELAKKLNEGGEITIPGNVKITGTLDMGGNLSMNGHEIRLRGIADGNHVVKYSNENGMDGVYIKGSKEVKIANDLRFPGGKAIKSDGRFHISAEEKLYLLPKADVVLTRDWGASGNIDMGDGILKSGIVNTKFVDLKWAGNGPFYPSDKGVGRIAYALDAGGNKEEDNLWITGVRPSGTRFYKMLNNDG